MEDKITLGRFIQTKRKEAGLSQRELAEKLYVTESAVSKWERGVSYPDITMISGICVALKISEHELCTASEDHQQHELERMAEKYTRFVRNYNLILCICYMAALIPCFVVFVVRERTPSKFFILLTSLMMTASVLNVPTLVEKYKGLITLGSFWASLNLLLLSGCIYSGGDWFIMAFISVLMSFSIVFLPFIVRVEPIASFAGNNKALICMTADSALIITEIVYGTLKYGTLYDLRSGGICCLWCLTLVWAVFVIVRYMRANVSFKISAIIATAAVWVLFSNPILSFLVDEKIFMFYRDSAKSVIIAVLVLAGISAAFAALGVIMKFPRKSD